MRQHITGGLLLAVAAFSATMTLGGCAIPEWTPESAKQAAATDVESDEYVSGSRLKSKDRAMSGVKSGTDTNLGSSAVK
jgi:hypothetical protein